ncbi:MAG: hypothetical protein JKY45_10410 [Emcibacter sp.]|nr:hypothetical protein [Emcibacter sp.]
MENSEYFSLYAHQVPEYPNGNDWGDALRWLISVMDYDDKSLPFIAGLLAYYYTKEGLTARQAKPANKVLAKVLDMHSAGVLYCQANEEDYPSAQTDLSTMDVEGEA